MTNQEKNEIEWENKAQKEPTCNHFMVWNCQEGYAYYCCDKCNFIDGEKTFHSFRQQFVEEILESLPKEKKERGKSWEWDNWTLAFNSCLAQIRELIQAKLTKE